MAGDVTCAAPRVLRDAEDHRPAIGGSNRRHPDRRGLAPGRGRRRSRWRRASSSTGTDQPGRCPVREPIGSPLKSFSTVVRVRVTRSATPRSTVSSSSLIPVTAPDRLRRRAPPPQPRASCASAVFPPVCRSDDRPRTCGYRRGRCPGGREGTGRRPGTWRVRDRSFIVQHEMTDGEHEASTPPRGCRRRCDADRHPRRCVGAVGPGARRAAAAVVAVSGPVAAGGGVPPRARAAAVRHRRGRRAARAPGRPVRGRGTAMPGPAWSTGRSPAAALRPSRAPGLLIWCAWHRTASSAPAPAHPVPGPPTAPRPRRRRARAVAAAPACPSLPTAAGPGAGRSPARAGPRHRKCGVVEDSMLLLGPPRSGRGGTWSSR